MFKPTVLIVGCFWLLPLLTASAGPLATSQVPANAKWVMHVDVDRFTASQTCAVLTNSAAAGQAFQQQLARYRAMLGLDPLHDLRQVTLFGEDVTGTRGVALVAGSLKGDAITRTLATFPQYRATPIDRWTLQKWRDRATGRELDACLYSSRLLIVASDESGVTGAMNVLNGAKPSLARAKGGLGIPTPKYGTFLTAATRGYAGDGQDPVKALILRNTESATVQIGETSGTVDAGLVLNAVSTDAAQQIEQVLNGLIVAANLSGSTEGLGRLAALSTVARDDRTLTIQLRCPARDAAQLLVSAMFPSR